MTGYIPTPPEPWVPTATHSGTKRLPDETMQAIADSEELAGTIGSAVLEQSGRPTPPKHVERVYANNLARWSAAVNAVQNGARDAKLLILGDSTADGVGGGSQATFTQANSWPSYMVEHMNAVLAPTAHGLAIPPSNSGAKVSPYDTRWTLGAGCSWRSGLAFDAFLGFGGKGTTISITNTAAGVLTFNDPRIMADKFDVYYVANDGGTGATFTVQATGGSSVAGSSSGHSAKAIKKITVSAGSAATTNVVTIDTTGGSGTLWIVGVEPYLSTSRRIRVANAGVSGSNSNGWVAYPSGSSSNAWNSFAAIRGYAPDLTIIDIGINDADPANLTDLSTYAANLASLIAVAQESGDVVLKSMIPSDSSRFAREQLLVGELRNLGLPLVDTFGFYGAYDSGLMVDAVHGNNTMYRDEGDYLGGVLWSLRPPATVKAPTLPVGGFNRRFAALETPGIVGSSAAVIPDLVGSGTVLTPGDVGGSVAAPTIGVDGGRRVLSFNGTNQGAGQVLAMAQPHSVVIVGRYTGFTANAIQPLTSSIGTSGSRANVYVDGPTGNLLVNAGSTLTGAAMDTQWHVFVFVFDATSVQAVDTAEVSGSAGTNPRTKFVLGSLDGSHFGQLSIADVVTYPFALSPTQRAATVASLRAAYGLD